MEIEAKIVKGARSIINQAEAGIKAVETKLGRSARLRHPETAYTWPTLYGFTGRRVLTLEDLRAGLEEAKKLLDKGSGLTNVLNAGVASLLALEIIEAIKYNLEEEPYPSPYTGFISDGTFRQISLLLADGRIPGIAVLAGEAGDPSSAERVAGELGRKSLLTLVAGPVAKQLEERGIELGIESRVVLLGSSPASVVHAINLAVRAALMFGAVEPGNREKIAEYIRDRLNLCTIVLGKLDELTLAVGGGAIALGIPVVTDQDIPELRTKFNVLFDLERCQRCLNCVRTCPQGVLGEEEGTPTVVNQGACDGCGRCLEVCPVKGVIEIEHLWPKAFDGMLVSEPSLGLISKIACKKAGVLVEEVRVKVPVDVSPLNQGESIRREEMYVEFGGGKSPACELVLTKSMEEVEDERIDVVGPDLQEMEGGKPYPLGILVEVAGKNLEKDFEPIIERQIHEYLNFIRGFMHIGSRNIIWCRVSKEAFEKGLRLEHLGKTLVALFKQKMPVIEKIQVKLITDRAEVEKLIVEAQRVYSERDARVKGLTDEGVEEFYGCLLCQSFAPNHVCVITPERISNCGAMTWLDAKTSTRINPGGPNFAIPKGEVVDEFRGEFAGVNRMVEEKSRGATKRVYLYSMFDYPHTSCGCFEALVFYIPEVDGFGVVDREFSGPAVNGLKFSTMAGEAGGGKQIFGFLGIGIEYLRSKKFLRADGGLSRVVWMSKKLKERIKDAIPKELYPKIASEDDVRNVDELKKFLEEKDHPMVKRWKFEG